MYGFTLSKFNLLIMVTAIFIIVSFFVYHLGNALTDRALNNLITNYSILAGEMLASPTYCDSLNKFLPESISLHAGNELYYVMYVSVQEGETPGASNFLIFSAAKREDPEHIISASSIRTSAEIKLYSFGQTMPAECPVLAAACEIVPSNGSARIKLDPYAKIPFTRNSIYLIKEVVEGKTTLHVFSCLVQSGVIQQCSDAKKAIGEKVHPASAGGTGEFKC